MNHLDATDNEALVQAGKILQEGGLVAFPTETVYGLGANALDKNAVLHIFSAKGRPADNPLIVHVAKKEDVDRVAVQVSKDAHKLIDAFWPGPLTLVLHKADVVPLVTTGNLSTVAVRMPDHAVAQKIISFSGSPVAAPSANKSGKPSPTEAQHVVEDLSEDIDALVDGGKTPIGVESTVVDMTGELPTILRQGKITQEDIAEVLGKEVLLVQDTRVVRSPGMKYQHYAPEVDLILVCGGNGFFEETAAEYSEQGKRIGIISKTETKIQVEKEIVIGENPNQIAKRIFAALRSFHKKEVDVILCQSIPEKGIGKAVMQIVRKAATKILYE